MNVHFFGGPHSGVVRSLPIDDLDATGYRAERILHHPDTTEVEFLLTYGTVGMAEAAQTANTITKGNPRWRAEAIGSINISVQRPDRTYNFHVNPMGRSTLVITGFGSADNPSAETSVLESLHRVAESESVENLATDLITGLTSKSAQAVPGDVVDEAVMILAAATNREYGVGLNWLRL